MKKALILIPTYNEADNIVPLLNEIFKITNAYTQNESLASKTECHVLVIDDNSADGTAGLIEANKTKFPDKLFLIKRKGKLGLGSAYITGFKYAIAQDYDFVFEMDADFSHNPKYLPAFLNAVRENDLVIGSRYIRGGGVVNWKFLRRFISKGGSLYARLILGCPLRDLTGGYKCFRRDVLKSLELDKILANGYSFQIELNYLCWLKNFKIKEIPIIFEDRVEGVSKMSRNIFWEAVWKVLLFRLRKNAILKNS